VALRNSAEKPRIRPWLCANGGLPLSAVILIPSGRAAAIDRLDDGTAAPSTFETRI
jgi:hypothetical protein